MLMIATAGSFYNIFEIYIPMPCCAWVSVWLIGQIAQFLIPVKSKKFPCSRFTAPIFLQGVPMKLTIRLIGLSLLGLVTLSGCRTYPDATGEFRFPIQEGNVAQGRDTFVRLGCPQCHSVAGVDLSDFTGMSFMSMPLGGEIVFAKTYGNLVTSIINPDHVISDIYLDQLPADQRSRIYTSPMYLRPDMKVTELIDVVAFLNSRYSLLAGYTEYYY
jgi:L-cysteine S-thiosulfotransferase